MSSGLERMVSDGTLNENATRLAIAASVIDGIGATVAHRHALVGAPFGITLPITVPLGVELVFWGSATAAPLAMDVAAWFLASRSPLDARRGRAMAVLGTLRLVGVVSEPATWGRRRPSSSTRAAAVLIPCHVALATAQIALGTTASRRDPSRSQGG